MIFARGGHETTKQAIIEHNKHFPFSNKVYPLPNVPWNKFFQEGKVCVEPTANFQSGVAWVREVWGRRGDRDHPSPGAHGFISPA